MKKPEVMLKEYVGRLSDDDLSYLNMRLSQKLCGDLSDGLNILQKNSEVDKWLCTAASAQQFFEMVDIIADYVDKESKRRVVPREKKDKDRRPRERVRVAS
jgi:hypothetical protein